MREDRTHLMAPPKGPQRFGSYELMRRIGAGGMGEVWLARKPVMAGIDKVCVVKKILPHLADNKQFIGRFLDEARAVVHLNHGNIAQVFEMGQEDDEYFMAMEYVEGKTLARIVHRLRERGETFPLGLALYIGSRVCDGLAYAHRKTDPIGLPLNLVHRDISPSNVVVSYDGEVKIIDFGAAQSAVKEEQTAARVVIGNLVYMSPEQARKMPTDGRADLFSASVVLWELISWQLLPVEGDYVARWRRAAYPKFDPPSKFNPDVTPEVDRVLMRGLDANPDQRPQNADALRDEINVCLARIAPSASQSSLAGFMRGIFSAEAGEERGAVAEAMALARSAESKEREAREEKTKITGTEPLPPARPVRRLERGNDYESVTAPSSIDPEGGLMASLRERPGPGRARLAASESAPTPVSGSTSGPSMISAVTQSEVTAPGRNKNAGSGAADPSKIPFSDRQTARRPTTDRERRVLEKTDPEREEELRGLRRRELRRNLKHLLLVLGVVVVAVVFGFVAAKIRETLHRDAQRQLEPAPIEVEAGHDP
jgi:serine/threonine-protein kinase